MARLNSWFSSGAGEKAIAGDYSAITAELPKAMFESGDKGTILLTTFGMDGLGGYTYRNKSGSEILAANNARIVGFYRDAGYNGGNRLWVEKGGETFHIDQYRTEKSNVTKDIAIGVGTVLTAGAASIYVSGGFGAAGALGATEATAGALPAAGGGAASGGAAAGGGLTLGQIGSAASTVVSTVGAVAKGIGQAAGAVGAVAGAVGAVNAVNSASKNQSGNAQQVAANAAQLTGGNATSMLESLGPYLLFGGAIITIAMLFKGAK